MCVYLLFVFTNITVLGKFLLLVWKSPFLGGFPFVPMGVLMSSFALDVLFVLSYSSSVRGAYMTDQYCVCQ